jgi:hypothetical protein
LSVWDELCQSNRQHVSSKRDELRSYSRQFGINFDPVESTKQ